MDFPPALVELLQRQLSQFGRIGATRTFQSPAVTSLAAGNTSSPVLIRFPEPVIVLAMYGQELAGTAANFAGVGVRVQIGGVEDLFVDGLGGGTYAPMLALFGQTQNWYPLHRIGKPGADWSVTFKNNTGGNVTPTVDFACLELRALANG